MRHEFGPMRSNCVCISGLEKVNWGDSIERAWRVKFCFKIKKTENDIYELYFDIEDGVMSRTRIFEQYAHFLFPKFETALKSHMF